jgi:hypothetical protein
MNVYLTLSDLEYQENARRGRCVSIPAGTKLKIKGEDVTLPSRTLGMPARSKNDDDFFDNDHDLWGPDIQTPPK